MRKLTIVVILILSFNGLFAQEWLKNLPKQKSIEGGLSFYDIQKAFYKTYPKDEIKNGKRVVDGNTEKIPGWKQFKRWEWYWESRVEKSNGQFPDKSALDVLFNNSNNKTLPTGGDWSNLGPTTSSGGYSGLGRINCITFHPVDEDTYWVGTPSGGVWKTTDDGNSWTVLTDDNNVLGVSAIALSNDFVNDNTMFIGTGDRDHGSLWTLGGQQSHDSEGIGILKSTDGGQTWETTGLSFTVAQKTVINKILINPNNNNEMLVGTNKGFYKSTDGGQTWDASYSSSNFIDLEYKPGDPNTVYASTKGSNYTSICLSEDAGDSWTVAEQISASRSELAVSPDQPNWVYALVANYDGGLKGVYKSTDSGENYSSVFYGGTDNALLSYQCDGSGGNSGQGTYDLCIAADPNDANIIYIGGINTWKSTDGGNTWNINSHWSSTCNGSAVKVHADKHCLEFQNGTSVLFEGNDGGLYKTTNSGNSWTFKGSGMSVSQIYRFGVSQTDGDIVICGLQDNGTKARFGNQWYDVTGGDGMECLVDYTNSNIQYSTYTQGTLYRTTSGWNGYTTISDNIPGGNDGAWVAPFIIDPSDHQTLYMGYGDVWKTTNKGSSWSKISNLDVYYKIRSMAIAPSNNQVLYIANHSNIWKTTNGGDNWSSITNNLPVSSSNITYITVKNDDENTLWVTFGGYNATSVYQSTNGGSSWTNISTGLPSLPAMTIVQNKENTDEVELYVGTDAGVYQKVGNDGWVAYNNNLPRVAISELEIYYAPNPNETRLRAATFGRGLWESPIMEVEVEAPTADFSANSVTVCKGTPVSFIDESTGYPTTWKWKFGDGGASILSQNPTKTFTNPGTYTVTLIISNNAGSDTIIKENYITVVPSANAGYNGNLTICEGETPSEDALFDALGGYPSASGTWSNTGLEYTYTVVGTEPCSDASSVVTVTEVPSPQASFTVDNSNEPSISFVSTSNNADNQTWTMGDGTEYTTANVNHTYSANGTYTVVLETSNDCGVDQKQQNIQITNIGILIVNDKEVKVYPNPTESQLFLDLPEENIKISLVSINGKTLLEEQSHSNSNVVLSMDGLKSGTYNLVLDFENNKREVVKVVKK